MSACNSTTRDRGVVEQHTKLVDTFNTEATDLLDKSTSLIAESYREVDVNELPKLEFDTVRIPRLPVFRGLRSHLGLGNVMDVIPDPTYKTLPSVGKLDVDAPPTPPNINSHSPPSLDFPSPPKDLPIVRQISMPSVPEVTLPEPPDIRRLVVPSAPDVDIQYITQDAPQYPVNDMNISGDNFAWFSTEYSSELNASVAKFLDELVETGADLSDEQWNRLDELEIAKTSYEFDKKDRNIHESFANRGFSLPPGVSVQLVQENERDRLDAVQSIIDKSAIQRKQQRIDSRRFYIDKAIGYEINLQQIHQQKMSTDLEAAKIAVEIQLRIKDLVLSSYNSRVAAFSEAVKAENSRIQSILAKIELYSAKVGSVEVASKIEESRIRAYALELEGIKSKIDIYSTEVNSRVAELQGERVKVEVYEASVKAFSERVRAETAKIEGFQSLVSAEKSKADVYESQVAGYSALVRAGVERVRSDVDVRNSAVAENKLELEKFTSKLQKNTVDLEQLRTRASLVLEENKLNIESQRLQSTNTVASTTMAMEQNKNKVDVRLNEIQLLLNNLRYKETLLTNMQMESAKILAAAASSMRSSINLSSTTGFSHSDRATTSEDCTPKPPSS